MTTGPHEELRRRVLEVDPRLDAFLDRLGRLSAEEWGRLDAASAPLRNGIIGRARLTWALAQLARIEEMHPVLNVLQVIGGLAVGAALMAAGWEPTVSPEVAAIIEESRERFRIRMNRLEDIQRLAPADDPKRPARTGALLAFMALMSLRLGRESQREMYQYVEPVIPLDSLVPPPRLLPVEAS